MQYTTKNLHFKQYFTIGFLLLQLLCFPAFVENSQPTASDKIINANWKLWKRFNNAEIHYQKQSNNGLYYIYAKFKVASSLSGFLLFLQDTKNIPNWLANAERAEILEQSSANKNQFITYFHAPWPVKNRALILKTQYQQNADLSIDIKVENGQAPAEKYQQYLLMELLAAHWHIEKVGDDSIEVNYQVLVDPKGRIPVWLANSLALSSMKTTIKNIQQQLPKSKWQKVSINTIKEPEFRYN